MLLQKALKKLMLNVVDGWEILIYRYDVNTVIIIYIYATIYTFNMFQYFNI